MITVAPTLDTARPRSCIGRRRHIRRLREVVLGRPAIGHTGQVMVVHGTQRFRDRVLAGAGVGGGSSTMLGPWYATLLRWRPTVALLVNQSTLLPVLVPLAPARTLLHRLPAAVAEVLAAHLVPRELIDAEVVEMVDVCVEPTANRSVVGVMNEFAYLAEIIRHHYIDDLLGLSMHLAGTPCSPLYRRHVSPDRELAALIAELGPITPRQLGG